MRIQLRDIQRRRIGRIVVDPSLRPTRATLIEGDREVFLNWETALDDAGHLRRCVACGCPDLFREKAFPQITGFVVVLAFAGFAIGVLGEFGLGRMELNAPMLLAMIAVLVLDVAILLFSKRRLVCYQCRSSYHDLPVARYHRPWDRATAERHPPPPAAESGASGDGPAAATGRSRVDRPRGNADQAHTAPRAASAARVSNSSPHRDQSS